MIPPGCVRMEVSSLFLDRPTVFLLLLATLVTAPLIAQDKERAAFKPVAAQTSDGPRQPPAQPPVARNAAAYRPAAHPQQPKSSCGPRELSVVPVPNVVGHSLSEAKMYLANSGLKLGHANPVTAQGAVGTVLKQDPSSATRTACGSSVTVWYVRQSASGENGKTSDWVIVPDVRKMTEDHAVETLHGRRLHLVEAKRVQTYKVTAGTVIDQAPKPGTKVTPESSVRVAVSFAPPKSGGGGAPPLGGDVGYQGPQLPCGVPGRSKAVTPTLRGHTQREAELSLQAIGLRLGTVVTLSTDAGQPGTVYKQKPDAGAGVICGGSVDLWVAQPEAPPNDKSAKTDSKPTPQRKRVLVPDVRGMSEAPAVEVLHKSGFHLGDVSKRQDPHWKPDTIAAQSPAPGSFAEEGSAISVTLATAPPISVPNVIGQTVARAVAILRTAGLQPGDIREKDSAGEAGIVTDQKPGAGAQIDHRGSVGLEVSRQIQYSVYCQPTATDPSVGQQISFQCRTLPQAADVQYQFFFGDGPPLTQADPAFPHVYNAARHYDAHGVAVIHGWEFTGGLIPVDVRDVTLTVTLLPPPLEARVGDSIKFTAESQPANPLTEYDFVFSDNKHSGFQSAPTYQRSFDPKGSYSVMVEARVGQGREARSEFSRINVTNPIPTGPIAAAVATVVLGGGALVQYRRRRWPFHPRLQPRLEPRIDVGQQMLDVRHKLISIEIRLRPVLSYGEQTIVATRPTVR